jgi:hypothetical protein
MSSSGKLLYLHYWNEYFTPSQPLKVDDDGRPIIKDNWKEVRQLLGFHSSTANTARRELLAAGLIRLSTREGYLLIVRDIFKVEPQSLTLLEIDHIQTPETPPPRKQPLFNLETE